MKSFFNRVMFVLLFQLFYTLSVFFLSEQYYGEWGVGFIIFFIFMIIISIKIIPSKKKILAFQKLVKDYKSMSDLDNEIKLKSEVLPMECPACKETENYWVFLEQEKCIKCGSTQWSTDLTGKEQSFIKLLEKKEKVRHFYSGLSGRILTKLKRKALFDTK